MFSVNVSLGIHGLLVFLYRDLRLKLDSTSGARARPFLQSILIPSMSEKLADCFERTPNVPEFLNYESPPRYLPSLDSPPLFPRVAQGRYTHKDIRGNTRDGFSNTTRVCDLVSMLRVASPELIDGEDGDTNSHHMEVVSGWSGFRSSIDLRCELTSIIL